MGPYSEQSKDQQGHMLSYWLLNNLKPQGRADSTSSMDGSPVRYYESSVFSHPNSITEAQRGSPHLKPVNILPEAPAHTSRKLSDREQRDCDVIGTDKNALNYANKLWIIFFIFIYTFIHYRETNKFILLHCTKIYTG